MFAEEDAEMQSPEFSRNDRNLSAPAVSAAEAARHFMEHLHENVGQLRQLYDGLFYWSMNKKNLPPFNDIRPYLLDLLSAAATTADQKIPGRGGTAASLLTPTITPASSPIAEPVAELMKMASMNLVEQENQYGYSSGAGYDLPMHPEILDYWRNESAELPPFRHGDEAWDDYSHRDDWLEQPVDKSYLSEDFDFQSNLSRFQKVPLGDEDALKARSNVAKQDAHIDRLLKGKKGPKREKTRTLSRADDYMQVHPEIVDYWRNQSAELPPFRDRDEIWDDHSQRRRNAWSQQPWGRSNISEDIDFESNLSAFQNVPLGGEDAAKAQRNVAKQDACIDRLLKGKKYARRGRWQRKF